MISNQGLLFNPECIKNIQSFSLPTNKKQLSIFFRACWILPRLDSKFPNFSLIAQPLYELLKAESPKLLHWTEKEIDGSILMN